MTSSTTGMHEEFGVFDYGLDTAQEDRARRLHASSVVVDMLFQGPCGPRCYEELPPFVPTGNTPVDWWNVKEAPVRHALNGRFDGFYECWARSGITAGNRQAAFTEPYDAGFSLAQAQFDRFEWFVKALTAADIRRAKADGKIAGFISTQDADGLDPGLSKLQQAYDMGLRMVGLTYNMQNAVGCGCTERIDAGVSNFGAKVIARMDELGMIVDTSHSGRQTTLDACRLSERPVVASHTSVEALYKVDRAKNDEEIRALAETGGVIGIYAVPFFLAPGTGVTMEAMLDHVDYVARLVGWQHVGIGTDWPLQSNRPMLEIAIGWLIRERGFRDEHNLGAENLVGFDDYRDFPNITRGLVSRGYDDDEIRGILGENFLRVFEAVCG